MMYLSAHDISEQYSISMKSARNIISEIRAWIGTGRYPENSVLDGCGVRVKADVVTDYLYHRKMLKDAVARNYVEPYRGENYESGRTEPIEVRNS